MWSVTTIVVTTTTFTTTTSTRLILISCGCCYCCCCGPAFCSWSLYLIVINECRSEAPGGCCWVSVVGGWGVGWGGVCKVIFVSNPTTVLRLCYIVLLLGLWQYATDIILLSTKDCPATPSKKGSSNIRVWEARTKLVKDGATRNMRAQPFFSCRANIWKTLKHIQVILLSNSSLRPRTRSWLYFPPMQQNHVNLITKPRQPCNITTSTL